MALITIVPQLLASGFWLLKLPVSWGAAALECSCVGGRQHRLGCSPREVVETWCCSPGSEKDEDHWCHEHGSLWAAWPRASGWQWLHGTNVSLCLRGAADERHFHNYSYLVFCHCPTSLSTWNMCSKLLQAQTHHKHLFVRALLVSWLYWTGLPGENWVCRFHKCCSWDFLVEFPVSLGRTLHRCFWLAFLFKTVGFWWTVYCSLCSEKNPNLCWSV